MSQLGHTEKSGLASGKSVLPSRTDPVSPACQVRKCQQQTSLDHPAGTDQDGWWYRETQLLCCLEVNDEIELRRLLHWKLAGALTA
jgi:hypothetical protein